MSEAAYRWALVALVDGSFTSASDIVERTGMPPEDAECVWSVYRHAFDHWQPIDRNSARVLTEPAKGEDA